MSRLRIATPGPQNSQYLPGSKNISWKLRRVQVAKTGPHKGQHLPGGKETSWKVRQGSSPPLRLTPRHVFSPLLTGHLSRFRSPHLGLKRVNTYRVVKKLPGKFGRDRAYPYTLHLTSYTAACICFAAFDGAPHRRGPTDDGANRTTTVKAREERPRKVSHRETGGAAPSRKEGRSPHFSIKRSKHFVFEANSTNPNPQKMSVDVSQGKTCTGQGHRAKFSTLNPSSLKIKIY